MVAKGANRETKRSNWITIKFDLWHIEKGEQLNITLNIPPDKNESSQKCY